MRWPFAPHRRWESRLSAFVDGELGAAAAKRLAEHLLVCPACTARAAELRQVKALLAALPEAVAPRSFAITPSMLGAPSRAPVTAAAPRRALLGAQLLAGVSLVAFFALLAIDLSGSATSHSELSSRAAPASGVAAAQAPSLPTTSADSALAQAPTPAKGIASPAAGGVGAQGVPSSVPATAGGRNAESKAPSLAPPPSEDAFSATADQPKAADGPVPGVDQGGDDGPSKAYRASEFGLLGLGLVAAVAAVVLARRLRRP